MKTKKNMLQRMWERSPVWTIIGTAAVSTGAFFGLRYLFRMGAYLPPEKKLPHGSTDIPSGWEARSFSTELHSALSGYPGSLDRKREIASELYSMTDGQLTAVYNDFNLMYAKENSGTMTDWIRDEYWTPSNFDTLLNRLQQLNLE